ncbi:DUF6531 domain-containing protein [Nocardia sp. NPDC058705]|uniref:DUF6531 domain-containing protein n=1 Tax=Nocardia sp. NPDC058705 TaxID=3346609 RepID=UPI0036C55C15
MTNPLIAAKEDTTDWSTGISLVSSVTDLSDAISGGSWIEVGLGVVGLGAEAVSLVVDPLGTLAGYGVGWLIEHCQPLQDALDWIAGDPAQIEAYAKTWDNVATRISEVATAQNKAVATDVSDWTGLTATAYKNAASNTTNLLTAANTAATAAASAIRMAGGIVAAVRETVRDLVAQTVGRLAVWAAELVFSVGLATPLVAIQATAYIAKTVSTISKLFSKLAKTMDKLKPLLKQLKSAFGDIAKAFKKTPSKTTKNTDNTTTTSPAGTKPADTSTSPSSTKPSDTSTNPASTPETPAKTTENLDSASTKPANTPSDPAQSNSGAGKKSREGDPEDSQTPDDKTTCGDPVDVATGEFLFPASDLALDGVLPVKLNRCHRSSYRFGRWFGPSWTSTLDARIIVDHSGVTLINEDGVLLAYPHTAPETPVLPLHGGLQWTLTRLTNGGYCVRDLDREIAWNFAALTKDSQLSGDYPIAAVSDRHSNWIRFHYGDDNAPTEVRSSGGYHVTFTTESGRITSVSVNGTRADGTAVVTKVRGFEYSSGNLSAVTNGIGGTTHYTYDRKNRMLSWRDSNGSKLANIYDGQGRVVSQQGTDGITSARFEYENHPSSRDYFSRTIYTDSLGATTTFEFDELLRLRTRIDPLGTVSSNAWTADGKLQRHVDSDLSTTTYIYNEDGKLSTIVRPDGLRIGISYQGRNCPSSITHVDGSVTRREYDRRGNLIATINADGIRTEYSYHSNGALHTISEAEAIVAVFDCDAAGRTTSVVDVCGAVRSIERDHFGRPVAVTNPLGATTEYEWNPEGRLLERRDFDGNKENWTYDRENNVVAHTDLAGSTTAYEYGYFNLVRALTEPGGGTTRYTWDTERRLLEISNPIGQTWSYTYDAAGRVTSEVDFNNSSTHYQYNSSSQIAAVMPATGVARYHSYDNQGRISGIRAESGEWVRYRHDPRGYLVSASSGEGDSTTHTLEFDVTATGAILNQILDGYTQIENAYDSRGRRTFRRLESGSESYWNRDISGRIDSMVSDGHSIDFDYNNAGHLVNWKVDNVEIIREVSPSGRVISQSVAVRGPNLPDPLGDQQKLLNAGHIRCDEYSYRVDGHLLGWSTNRRGASVRDRAFVLDNRGRVAEIADNDLPAHRYVYDNLDNIVDETADSDIEHCGADASENGGTIFGRREYRDNLLVRAGRTRYYYDPAGRLIRKTRARISREPETWHFRYNAFDQLVDVFTPERHWWTYTYDAFGRRTTKRRRSSSGAKLESVKYIWEGTTLLGEVRGDQEIRWDYIPGTFRPIAQRTFRDGSESESAVVVTDSIGMPTELIDSFTGVSLAVASSNLWGITTWSGSSSTPLRFPGQQYDVETGLHYNLARFYDPETGRYLTTDPLGLAPSPNPNTYPYNPTSWADPLGLEPDGDLVRVYRGTDAGVEHQVQRENGFMMSDAARHEYYSTGSVEEALKASQRAHTEAIDEWGSLDNYIQAHGEWGQEVGRDGFGPRSMMSFTTDEDVARRFGDTIYTALVPRSSIHPQTLPGAGESEVLIPHMVQVTRL